MNKFKIIHKKGMCQLIVKGQKGQQLCERELYAINNGEIAGLIPVTVITKGLAAQLVYDLDGYVTLADYVSVPMDKACFTAVLSEILEVLRCIRGAVFNEASLWLAPEYVFVEPQSQKLLFLYVPLAAYDCGTELRAFLLALMQYCTFNPSEDLDYVSDCIGLLNKGVSFSVFELEQYMSKLRTEVEQAEKPKLCPKCQCIQNGGFAFCCECGTPLQDADEALLPQKSEGKAGAYLFRESTGQRILVDRPYFGIGKSLQNNAYCIPELRTISRTHAAIIVRDNRYYVTDLGSTNGTFLEEDEVLPETEKELLHGSRLRLANETFVFEINQ
jgi:hypothetical protein